MLDLNLIPRMMKEDGLSVQQVSNLLAECVMKNPAVFNLEGFDDDFKSEIILKILETGDKMMKNFDPTNGNFFSYFYCCIISITSTLMRRLAIEGMHHSVICEEQIRTYEEKITSYENIDFHNLEKNVVYKHNNYKNTKLYFDEKEEFPKDKTLLVVALKSSFYITEKQIRKIAELYEIEFDQLHDVILQLKNELLKKQERKSIYEERRNRAYYYHKRYEKQISQLQENSEELDKENLIKILDEKNTLQEKRWKNYNQKLQDGFLSIKPSNKTVADVLGICERQVTYYMIRLKKNKKQISIPFCDEEE